MYRAPTEPAKTMACEACGKPMPAVVPRCPHCAHTRGELTAPRPDAPGGEAAVPFDADARAAVRAGAFPGVAAVLAVGERRSTGTLRIVELVLLALAVPATVVGFVLMVWGVKRWGTNGFAVARGVGAFVLGIASTVYVGKGELGLALSLAAPAVATVACFVVSIAIRARAGGLW